MTVLTSLKTQYEEVLTTWYGTIQRSNYTRGKDQQI